MYPVSHTTHYIEQAWINERDQGLKDTHVGSKQVCSIEEGPRSYAVLHTQFQILSNVNGD